MQADPKPAEVTVCICTFRRNDVVQTIESLSRQVVPPDLRLTILVIDNDDEPSAAARVDAASAQCPWPVGYLHAPSRNISIARNAALGAVATRWMAFIDDDETAVEDWIARLWGARDLGEAIFGPSLARYPEGTPDWGTACDFHSSTPAKKRPLETGYSGNVLLDLDFVRAKKMHFALELGRSGGEDTIFFMQLRQNGGRLHYVEEAIVYEHPSLQRISMRWVLKRKYRAGQTHAMMELIRNPNSRAPIVASSAAKTLASLGAGLACVFDGIAMRRWLARAVFHFGVMAFALRGGKLAELY